MSELTKGEEVMLRQRCVELAINTISATNPYRGLSSSNSLIQREPNESDVLILADKIYNFIKNEKILTNNEV